MSATVRASLHLVALQRWGYEGIELFESPLFAGEAYIARDPVGRPVVYEARSPRPSGRYVSPAYGHGYVAAGPALQYQSARGGPWTDYLDESSVPPEGIGAWRLAPKL